MVIQNVQESKGIFVKSPASGRGGILTRHPQLILSTQRFPRHASFCEVSLPTLILHSLPLLGPCPSGKVQWQQGDSPDFQHNAKLQGFRVRQTWVGNLLCLHQLRAWSSGLTILSIHLHVSNGRAIHRVMLTGTGPQRLSINVHPHQLFVPLSEGVDETRVGSVFLDLCLFFRPVCGIPSLGFLILFLLASAILPPITLRTRAPKLCEPGAADVKFNVLPPPGASAW
jgi:hypothetical protein